MNPKLCKRFNLTGTGPGSPVKSRFVSIGSEDEIEKTSVRDAALLLSIADICQSEIKTGGLGNLWRDDLTLPRFPALSPSPSEESADDAKRLAPRTDSLQYFLSDDPLYHRARSVSFDHSPRITMITSPRTTSPMALESKLVSPMQSPRVARRLPMQRTLKAVKARRELKEDEDESPAPVRSTKSRPLQDEPPKGVPIKIIYRKKFSWKNYKELEQFLIDNREQYLKHSALNYTVQQKKYNNELTERLLELATQHGYVFDTDSFNFVVVRDRIRCYYKSFVQSAKKRGVLLGYAARKAGLMTEDELEEAALDDHIVDP